MVGYLMCWLLRNLTQDIRERLSEEMACTLRRSQIFLELGDVFSKQRK